MKTRKKRILKNRIESFNQNQRLIRSIRHKKTNEKINSRSQVSEKQKMRSQKLRMIKTLYFNSHFSFLFCDSDLAKRVSIIKRDFL